MDARRPAEVTSGFRERVRAALAPLGFLARARGASFVRRRDRVTHRVELTSNRENAPGWVACYVTLWYQDSGVATRATNWRAGRELRPPDAGDDYPVNVARSRDASALLARIRAGLDFFELLEDARKVHADVCRRYVPGFVEPCVVVPYLVARLGPNAAIDYAASLLAGRPELWPAFLGRPSRRGPAESERTISLDHGTDLARSLASLRVTHGLRPPKGTVRSTRLPAANLRCFYGRQLRAWGEPEAAGMLRTLDDSDILDLPRPSRNKSVEAAQCVLRAATGKDRPPRRRVPRPILYQYHELHAPFAPA